MITKIFLLSAVFLFFSIFLFKVTLSEKKAFFAELLILFFSLYLHLLLSIVTPRGDSVYFSKVLAHLAEGNYFNFYNEFGITYPPLFNFLCILLGRILLFLNIPFDWTRRDFIFCIKIPGILCEFVMAWIVYLLAKKYVPESKRPLALFLILLNPGYLLVTSYISQVDALFTLFMALTLYCILSKRLKTSYFCFAAAILFKFQALFITPVLIYGIISQVILENFSWKRFWQHLLTGLTAIACMLASYIPFIYDFKTHSFSEGGLLVNFTSSVASYGKASQNAYNFWTLTGYNLIPHSNLFGPFSCNTWGTLFIILLVLLSGWFFLRNMKNTTTYPMLAALLVSGVYCFATKMMARYLYPAIILLIIGYAIKPTTKRFICALSFSIALFLCTGFDYLVYPWRTYHSGLILPYIISAYVVLCFFYLVYVLWQETKVPDQSCR